MARKRVLITGAAGYLSRQLLPVFRERYDLVLLDRRKPDDIDDIIEIDLDDVVDIAANPTTSTTSSRSISSIRTSTPIGNTSKASMRSFT